MSDNEDYQFEKGDAGSAGIELVEAGGLKNGSLVMIKGHPCKVVSFSTAKTGKHGAAKAMVTGIDVFTSNKYECTFSTGDKVEAPVLTRKEYTCIDINDEGFMTLMDENGEMKEDLRVPEDEWLKDQVDRLRDIIAAAQKEAIVTVISALGQEKFIQAKEGNNL